MSGLFRRLSSRRSEGPEGAPAEPGAAEAPSNAPAEPGGHESLLVDPAAQTRVLREGEGTRTEPDPAEPAAETPAAETPADPAATLHPVVRLQTAPHPEPPYAAPLAAEGPVVPVSDLPAGIDPDELAAAPPTSARRSRLRRRVSFLRAAREVLLRDLGGFVYELHRTAGDIEHDAHRRLRELKLARLTRLDAELHELELRLDDVRRHVVVREPGVGGECPHCGELFGSDAHYCAHCGLPLTDSARRAVARGAAEPEPVAAAPAPQPAPDQPTEEYSPLGHEFDWPTRAGADDPHEQPTRVVRGEGAADETGDEPRAAGGGDGVGGEPETAGDDAAAAEAAGGDIETPRDDAAAGEAAGGDIQAPGDDAAAADGDFESPRDDAAASGAAGAAHDGQPEAARDDAPGAAGGEAEAADDDATGAEDAAAETEARDDTTAPDADAAPRAPAAGGEPEAGAEGADRGPGAWHDSPGDAYTPLERRR